MIALMISFLLQG